MRFPTPRSRSCRPLPSICGQSVSTFAQFHAAAAVISARQGFCPERLLFSKAPSPDTEGRVNRTLRKAPARGFVQVSFAPCHFPVKPHRPVTTVVKALFHNPIEINFQYNYSFDTEMPVKSLTFCGLNPQFSDMNAEERLYGYAQN